MFCCFSLYRAVQTGNQGAGQNLARIGVYCVVQTLNVEGLLEAVRTFLSCSLVPFCMAWYREIPRNSNFLEKNIKKHAATLDLLHDRILSFTEVCV